MRNTQDMRLSERYCIAKENWRILGSFILFGTVFFAFCVGWSYDPPRDASLVNYQHAYTMIYLVLLCIGTSSIIPYTLAVIYWLKEGTAELNEEIDANRKARER